MRRLFPGGSRSEVDPFTRDRDEDRPRPQSARSVDSGLVSRFLVPRWIERRAITVRIATPQTEYPLGARIPFEVTMKNELPVPVTLTTRSPVLWTWTVDGLPEASSVDGPAPPDEPGSFSFERGERKRFSGRWTQKFRVTEREWERATPGEYTIGAGINVEDPTPRLADEVTVRLVEE
jgi:hypothetical protein